MKNVREYEKSMYDDQDFAKVAFEFRTALLRLAEAASMTVRAYDGHHRLCLEIANAYAVVGNERTHRQ